MKTLTNFVPAIIISVLLWVCPDAVTAGVTQADSAYTAHNYERALALYKDVVREEGVSPQLLFNMGNAAFNAGDYGQAALAFERALRLQPGNKEIRNNLEFLRNKVEDANKAELKGKRAGVTPDDSS
ncbi:MAG: tetratricopeptide repeat protein, partial [Bacteroidales bacterium]|nr:tetratricopeptide repeat protein [Bacteroidales bacterium]